MRWVSGPAVAEKICALIKALVASKSVWYILKSQPNSMFTRFSATQYEAR